MIVHRHKFCFIHIPKNAGTAINHAILTGVVGNPTSGQVSSLSVPVKAEYGLTRELKHGTAAELRQYVTNENWNEYYKVAVIRNPWDRTVSAYLWAKQNENFAAMTFPQYISLIQYHRQHPKHPLYNMIRTQMSYVTSEDGDIMVDDVFQFEHIDLGIREIESHTGLDLSHFSHHNVTKTHKSYASYYTTREQYMVRQFYADDINYFNYRF